MVRKATREKTDIIYLIIFLRARFSEDCSNPSLEISVKLNINFFKCF